jgi:hypothetical protein
MAQDFGTSGGPKPRRTAYFRATASYTRATDLAGVIALKATGTKYGHFIDKTKKNSIKKGDVVELDDATPYVQEWIGGFEGSLMNATPANVDDFDATFENVKSDVILDDEVQKTIKVYKGVRLHGEEDEVDGDKNVLNISGSNKASLKSALRDTFSYASFS